MVRLSNSLVGVLNFLTFLASLPILVGGIWLSVRGSSDCDKFLDKPLIILGVFLMLVSLAGLIGSCCRVSWLLWVYLLVMFLLIVIVFCFTIFAFFVTNKGAGEVVSGRGYKEYKLGDYSNWLQKRVEDSKNWKSFRSCIQQSHVCENLADENIALADFIKKNLSPLESGCCKPPTECGFKYVNATNWSDTTGNASASANADCKTWSNDKDKLCYDCRSCKAGLLANLKSDWKKVAIVNITFLIILEVNLQNVLTGMVTILTGRNKPLVDDNYENQQGSSPSSSDVSFLASEKNGDSSQLHSSVYLPSAPQQVLMETLKYNDYKEVLETDPPEWLPDSYTTACMQCASVFTAITCGRHHCRFCGGVFCRACTKGRCMMPVKFRLRDPQRVCDKCYDRLDPLQGMLINSLSNAVQTAKHDVLDWTSMRGWINLPVSLSMEHEIYKASNSLKIYCQAARLKPEMCIPQAVLNGASGLAILTVAKVGALLTYKFGTGLVIARRFDGSWSAPSAIVSFGLGWGAQIGGELTDYIIVLHGFKAVKAFTSQMHISLGAGLSAAAGPVGRVVEADFRAGDRGSGMCYTYSYSKGAFVGVSLEGNIVMTRMDTNLSFYGDPYLTARDILLGNVERPRAAQLLYSTLHNVFTLQ